MEDRSAGRWCDECQQHGSHYTDRHVLVVTPRFKCPECDYEASYKGGVTYHKRREHRKYGIAGRCQAYLLTPSSRRWSNKTGQSIRCQAPARDLLMPFCGNHDQLAGFISEIVWKEEDGSRA